MAGEKSREDAAKSSAVHGSLLSRLVSRSVMDVQDFDMTADNSVKYFVRISI